MEKILYLATLQNPSKDSMYTDYPDPDAYPKFNQFFDVVPYPQIQHEDPIRSVIYNYVKLLRERYKQTDRQTDTANRDTAKRRVFGRGMFKRSCKITFHFVIVVGACKVVQTQRSLLRHVRLTGTCRLLGCTVPLNVNTHNVLHQLQLILRNVTYIIRAQITCDSDA